MSEGTDEGLNEKKKKPARPKADPEHKQFLKDFVDVLLKPTRRRMNFLYPALCRPDNGMLVLGTNPDQIYFGNPEEGLTVIQFHDRELFDKFWSWLISLGMRTDLVEAVDIGKIAAALSKVKGDWTKVDVSRRDDGLLYIGDNEKSCSTAIYSLFTMMRFGKEVELFKPALDPQSNSIIKYPVEVIKDVPTIARYEIAPALLDGTQIHDFYPRGIRVLTSRGYDLLCAEHIKDEVQYNGLKFWHCGGSAILYAAVIETPRFTFLSCRCNVFLIPM